MPSLEIHPLSELRDEAARLLGERYARQRALEPLLPDAGDVAAHLPDDDGVVATRGGAAVAYLAGAVRDGIATVGFAGHAATEAEALRDLYAVLAERWDVSRFAVAVPASDGELIDTWFRLAFGCQFMWGVRETEADGYSEVQLRQADRYSDVQLHQTDKYSDVQLHQTDKYSDVQLHQTDRYSDVQVQHPEVQIRA